MVSRVVTRTLVSRTTSSSSTISGDCVVSRLVTHGVSRRMSRSTSSSTISGDCVVSRVVSRVLSL